MARSGRLRRSGTGLNYDQSNPKTGPGATPVDGRFRLIVDGWAKFRSNSCAPPRPALEDAASPSTIRLKRASTIAEIRMTVRLRLYTGHSPSKLPACGLTARQQETAVAN